SANTLDGRVSLLVAELGALSKQDRLAVVYRTGKRVIDVLYDGDLDAWQNRRKEDRRYAKLEGHPELPISRDQLYQSLQIYALCCRFPTVLTSKLFTLSHALAILPRDPEAQEALVKTLLERKVWHVRAFRQASGGLAKARPGTGRPKTPPVYK